MPLNWNVANVKDNDNVCFFTATENSHGRQAGNQYLKASTDALIWLTMSVGLDEITEDNIDEWLYRLAIEYAINDSTLYQIVDGKSERVYHDENSLRQHIGLYTNAGTISRKEYHEKILRILHNNGSRIIKDAEEYNRDFEKSHKMTDKGWVTI